MRDSAGGLACCRACLQLSAQSACLMMGGLPAGTALQQHLGVLEVDVEGYRIKKDKKACTVDSR
jgi:hypothetical protein